MNLRSVIFIAFVLPLFAQAEVIFRAARPADKRAINILVRDPGFIEYYSGPRQVDPDDFYHFLKAYREAGGNFVIADRDSNRMVGVGNISISTAHVTPARYEITYAILPAERGQGVAREAIKKMLTDIYRTDNAAIVTARVAGLNKISQYLLETEGFVATDTFDRTQHPRRYLHYEYKPTCENLTGG